MTQGNWPAKARIMTAAPPQLYASLLVALGGGIGALLRYQIGRGLTYAFGASAMTNFPWAPLTVNVVGSLGMGLLAGWLAGAAENGEQLRLVLGIGLLGGFTTFSAFSLEMMMLMNRGDHASAFIYGSVSVMAGLAALYMGLIVMKLFHA